MKIALGVLGAAAVGIIVSNHLLDSTETESHLNADGPLGIGKKHSILGIGKKRHTGGIASLKNKSDRFQSEYESSSSDEDSGYNTGKKNDGYNPFGIDAFRKSWHPFGTGRH